MVYLIYRIIYVACLGFQVVANAAHPLTGRPSSRSAAWAGSRASAPASVAPGPAPKPRGAWMPCAPLAAASSGGRRRPWADARAAALSAARHRSSSATGRRRRPAAGRTRGRRHAAEPPTAPSAWSSGPRASLGPCAAALHPFRGHEHLLSMPLRPPAVRQFAHAIHTATHHHLVGHQHSCMTIPPCRRAACKRGPSPSLRL